QLHFPCGVAAAAAGNVYIADTFNNRVRKVSPSGVITTVAGTGNPGFSGDGGPASAALLDSPQALAVDAAGDVYIADALNDRIRKLDAATGTISTVVGNGSYGFGGDGGPATAAALTYVFGLAVDSGGNL